jgi:hypothetical protein
MDIRVLLDNIQLIIHKIQVLTQETLGETVPHLEVTSKTYLNHFQKYQFREKNVNILTAMTVTVPPGDPYLTLWQLVFCRSLPHAMAVTNVCCKPFTAYHDSHQCLPV